MLKLYTYDNNPRAQKALIAAQYGGVEIDVPAFEWGKTNKTPEFLADVPTGKVPALITPEGGIFESNAIARYVARMGEKKFNLYGGGSAFLAGQVEAWLDWSGNEMVLPSLAILMPMMGFMEANEKVSAKATEDLHKGLKLIDSHLLYRTYMVGNSVSLADIVLVCNLVPLMTKVFDAKARNQYTNLMRWFDLLVHQPEFQAVLGDVTLLGDKPKPAAKKDKKEQPKKEQPKKEEPKKEEAAAAPAKKPKNPLDLLPPSSFVLDDWKRLYSNEKNTRKACEGFWKMFDAANEGDYSLWFADYKYNEENEKLFMVCNLVGGMIQRLDAVRKYGFGNVLIQGEEGKKMSITACWLFRGPEVPDVMKAVDDTELYDWVKVDTKDKEQRKLVDDYMCWEGELLEAKFGENLDGKTFK